MTHPETTGAGATPVPQGTTAAAGTDQERPVPSADERNGAPARADRSVDAMQQARQLAQVGEMTAALTILRALIAREPKQVRARQVMAELLGRSRLVAADAEGRS